MNDFIPYAIALTLIIGLFIGLTPVAQKIGLVDHPNERKKHASPTPLIGGLCISMALFLSLLLFDIPYGSLRILFFCMGIITLIGILDDRNDIPAYSKFLVQIFISVVLVFGDQLIITSIGDIWSSDSFQGLGFLAIPFTLVAIVGVINALNLIDGHDGLAGIMGLFGCTSVLFISHQSGVAVASGEWTLLSLLALFIATFLIFNIGAFKDVPKIFLGDAGSMLIGLILAYFLISLTQPSFERSPVFSPVTAPWLIGLPLLDMFRVVIKRTISGRSLIRADRQHIHHLLLNFGCSRLGTLLILAVTQLIFCTFGILSAIYKVPEWVIFWSFVVLQLVYFQGCERLAGRREC